MNEEIDFDFNEIILINPSDIQKQIYKIVNYFKNDLCALSHKTGDIIKISL
jgi:DICT domain-containing protein